MQEGAELAAVQVPPHSLRGVVLQGRVRPALRARPRRSLLVSSPDIYALIGDVQVHLRDGPWTRDAQQVAVQLDVSHGVRCSFG
jgi:hypothetical protein